MKFLIRVGAGLFLWVGLFGFPIMAQQKDIQDNVKTRSLEIVDKDGVTKMVLHVNDNGEPEIQLFSPGKPSVTFLKNNGLSMIYSDKLNATFGFGEDGTFECTVTQAAKEVKNRHLRYWMHVERDGSSILDLKSKDQQSSVVMMANSDGSSFFSLRDRYNKVRLKGALDDLQRPFFLLSDGEDKGAGITVTVPVETDPFALIFDHKHDAIWRAP